MAAPTIALADTRCSACVCPTEDQERATDTVIGAARDLNGALRYVSELRSWVVVDDEKVRFLRTALVELARVTP